MAPGSTKDAVWNSGRAEYHPQVRLGLQKPWDPSLCKIAGSRWPDRRVTRTMLGEWRRLRDMVVKCRRHVWEGHGKWDLAVCGDCGCQAAVECVRQADVVICCVGTTAEWEMEGVDRENISLLPQVEMMVERVMQVNPNAIVVNQSGAAVDLRFAKEARAILHAQFAGQEAGNGELYMGFIPDFDADAFALTAIADVLFGNVNPSGRTTDTWPNQLGDISTYNNFPCSDNKVLTYQEGMNVGYRQDGKTNRLPPLFREQTYTSQVEPTRF